MASFFKRVVVCFLTMIFSIKGIIIQVRNVRNLGLNKTDFILNMFNNYESIAGANKTLNMNMNGSTTCLIY